ncbi:MAG: transaldolase [Bdellovibrionales bacterium RIFOXYD1_FULL_53_11]|nr:MAG: transaldolase [Bdellovibrionales bacterium RIFOXYD1_FULL_53_11]
MNAKSPYTGKIKLFSDGADKKTIFEMNETPLISGITTNPSLLKKAGVTDYRAYSREILQTVTKKQISFEVLADEFDGMRKQALEIATWGKNVYVKIPVINSRGDSAASLIRELSQKGVQLNITAITTFEEVLDACQALKGGAPSYISIFAGRIADTGRDPMPLIHASCEARDAIDHGIEVLWASTREFYNIIQAEQAGCDIITAPPEVLKKLSGLNKGLRDLSLETVQIFIKDTKSAGFSL